MTGLPIPVWPNASTPEGRTLFSYAFLIFHTWKAYDGSDTFALGKLARAEADSTLNPNA